MTLYDALYMYAMENVFTHFEKPYKAQLHSLNKQIDQTIELLQKLGPEAGALTKKLDSSFREYLELMEKPCLQTGISVGMEVQKLLE